MKYILTITLIFTALAISSPCQTASAVTTPPTASKTPNETEDLIRRFQNPGYASFISSAIWTVTHDYADKKRIDEVLGSITPYFEAMQKQTAGDGSMMEQLGGVASFKAKLGEWLNDNDKAIRAFAAILIGISGDREKIPQLLKLIKRNDPDDEYSNLYDKGRAATALGLLGAVEQKPDILLLLKSKNRYDRSGAITALTLMGAKENAKDVVAILKNKELGYDDDTPIYFLIETGTAAAFKKELAVAMSGTNGREVAETAMYALVSIDAKEYAPQIARLLTDKSRKGEAAKALALLGAAQYSGAIGALLTDREALVQSAAALALGILKAKKYAPRLVQLMNSQSVVNSYAAAALVLMDSPQYSPQARGRLAEFRAKRVYLTAENAFHPLVAEKAADIIEKLKTVQNR